MDAKKFDRDLVGKFIEREITATTNWNKFSSRVDVARSTLYRVRDADPIIIPATFSRIERGLSLPTGTFNAIGAHDFDVLRNVLGLNEETVVWLERQATELAKTSSAESVAPVTPIKRGPKATQRG